MKQIPFGNDSQKGNCNCKGKGSYNCILLLPPLSLWAATWVAFGVVVGYQVRVSSVVCQPWPWGKFRIRDWSWGCCGPEGSSFDSVVVVILGVTG